MKICQAKYNNLFYKVLARDEQSATANGKKTIFLSYKKSDNENYLKATGINIRDKVVELILHSGDCAVWVDDSGIVGGVDWDEGSIRKALNACSMMVLLVTPNIFDSEGYIARVEIPTVKNRRDRNNNPLPIYPVIVDRQLAEQAQDTWDRVSKLTGSKEQGTILLDFHNESTHIKKFELAIKNALGMIPDPGIEGKINSVKELIRTKQYSSAAKANDELRLLAPGRYESYWFELKIITKSFALTNTNGKAEYNAYKMAEKYADINTAESIKQDFDNYILYVINYNDVNNKYWAFTDAIVMISYLSKNAISSNEQRIKKILGKYIPQYTNKVSERINCRIKRYESVYDSENSYNNISIEEIIDKRYKGDAAAFEYSRLVSYKRMFSEIYDEINQIMKGAAYELFSTNYKDSLYNTANQLSQKIHLLTKYEADFYRICDRRNELNESDEVLRNSRRSEIKKFILIVLWFCLIIVCYYIVEHIKPEYTEGIISGLLNVSFAVVGWIIYSISQSKKHTIKKILKKEYSYLSKIQELVPQIKADSQNY